MTSIERQLENGMATALSSTGLNIFKRDTEGLRLLPSLVVESSIGSEEIIPNSGVFKCPISVTYSTRADTTTRAAFDSKFQEILQIMYQSPNLASVLTTATLKVFIANINSESPAVLSANRTWSKAISIETTCTSL